jgi:hypothetical protein
MRNDRAATNVLGKRTKLEQWQTGARGAPPQQRAELPNASA